MQTGSPKKMQRAHPKTYSNCLLYNTKEAKEKLIGLKLASCNPLVEQINQKPAVPEENSDVEQSTEPATTDLLKLSVSDKMSCNFCDTTFVHRVEQKRHYRSDWHRYNLKQRIKGKPRVTEEQFEDISGNISSLSGSDSDSDSDSDIGTDRKENRKRLVPGAARKLRSFTPSSTDSESDTGNQVMDKARRLPKLYFRNEAGELLSVYRCVICHKKEQPSRPEDLITMVTDVLGQMNWAVFMVGGGHFAAAIYNKDQLVAHKTFHRYVVRAKRGTAQSSRDSQGNAPKSAGASLRRYNEAALTQDIQDLISSWSEHIKTCDRIFLRAPSFNRKIFFSGKSPPFNKEDSRIRLIPFQTRRPTFNEVRRVYEMLASIECYGDESELQDLIPISPPQVFNPQSGQLTVRDESQLTQRQRKLMNRRLRSSPLVTEQKQASGDTDQTDEVSGMEMLDTEVVKALPDHLLEGGQFSSGTSTASETELMETMETMNLLEHKEFYGTKKPKRRKKKSKQKRQTEPESNVMDEEKYHLKNSLYTACKVGDTQSLKNLLAIFTGQSSHVANNAAPQESSVKQGSAEESHENKNADDGDIHKFDSDCSGKHADENVNSVEQGLYSNIVEINIDKNTGKKENSEEVNNDRTALEESDCNRENVLTGGSKDLGSDIEDMKINISIDKTDTAENFKESVNDVHENDSIIVFDGDKERTVSTSDTDLNAIAKPINAMSEKDKAIPSPNSLPVSLDHPGKGKEPVSLPDMSPVVTLSMLSEIFGDNNTTLLHVAAREGHKAVVWLLLEAGADPSVREKSGLTPYMVSKDKPTRNEFRKYMGRWPDKYDYEKAQIPAPLTEEMEAEKKKKEAEKRKAQKKVKQEKQKVKREEEAKIEAEEKEKKRFLNLSDREKRAIAAERRLLTQAVSAGTTTPVLVRCFQCGEDMTGKTPFEYNANKFCTSKCLQQHRKSGAKS